MGCWAVCSAPVYAKQRMLIAETQSQIDGGVVVDEDLPSLAGQQVWS